MRSAATHASSCFCSSRWHPLKQGQQCSPVVVMTDQSGHLVALGALACACCHLLVSFVTSQPNMHQTLQPIQAPQLGTTRAPRPFLPPLALCVHHCFRGPAHARSLEQACKLATSAQSKSRFEDWCGVIALNCCCSEHARGFTAWC